jgi:hypothetical protein
VTGTNFQSGATDPSSDHDEDIAETSYRIVRRENDSFVVEIVRVGALPQVAAGFATEGAAQGWIAQDQRLSKSTDPFSTPAGQRRRGF